MTIQERSPSISIQLNSNRPDAIISFFNNIEETTDHPEKIEVLLHIDDTDSVMAEILDKEIVIRKFSLKYISTNLVKGYGTLWKPLNELWKLTHQDAYFIINLSDEINFRTKGWDTIVNQYRGYYADDVFRLRCSKYKYRNYTDFWENGFAPDSVAFYTRKWLELSGDWNPCLGPDSFQQCIAFYLFTSDRFSSNQINRDVPIPNIEVIGEGAGIGIIGKKKYQRMLINNRAWFVLMSYKMQQEACRRAMRIKSYIFANSSIELCTITEKTEKKEFHIRSNVGNTIDQVFKYKLSKFYLCLVNLYRLHATFYYAGGGESPKKIKQSVFINLCTYLDGGHNYVFNVVLLKKRISSVKKRINRLVISIKRNLSYLIISEIQKWYGRIYDVFYNKLEKKGRGLAKSIALKISTKRIYIPNSTIILMQIIKIIIDILFNAFVGLVALTVLLPFALIIDVTLFFFDLLSLILHLIIASIKKGTYTIEKVKYINIYPNFGSVLGGSINQFLQTTTKISIQLSSNNLDNLKGLVENICDSATRPELIELIIHIDKGADEIENYIKGAILNSRLKIKYISTNVVCNFSELWKVYDLLLPHASKDAIYFAIISDEVRFSTQNWDEIIYEYENYYPDNIFRIRLSKNKFFNYLDEWDCGYAPDNVTFYSRRWIEIQNGWCPCAGPDSFQQLVSYYMMTTYKYSHLQFYREIPEPRIKVCGDMAGVGLEGIAKEKRIIDNNKGWFQLFSFKSQSDAKKRACLLMAVITGESILRKNPKANIQYSDYKKRINLYINGNLYKSFDYRVSSFFIMLRRIVRMPLIHYYAGGGYQTLKQHPLNGIRLMAKTYSPLLKRIMDFIDSWIDHCYEILRIVRQYRR